jgi:hypothetical protein
LTVNARASHGTPLAGTGCVRSSICAVLAVIASPSSRAEAEPLWQAEVRAGYGIAMGGSGEWVSKRPTPLTLAAIARFAVHDEPALAGYGGLLIETLDRNAAGAVFGVQLTPRNGALRLSAGGSWIAAPYTLWGPTTSLGVCVRAGAGTSLCSDLQLTAYVGGNDLPEGRTVTQGQFVLGIVFDAH